MAHQRRTITAHRDSFLNLSGEMLSVYPSTIFYPWHDIISSDGRFPVLDGVYTLVGLETRESGYVLAVEENTQNILEVQGIDSSLETLIGWTITAATSADFSTNLGADVPNENMTSSRRFYSSANAADQIYITSDNKRLFSRNANVTLSFYYRTSTTYSSAKVTATVTNVGIGTATQAEQDFDPNDEWTRAVLTFVATSDIDTSDLQNVRIAMNFQGYMDIAGVQIETKDFPTAWYGESNTREVGYVKLANDTLYPEFFPEDQIAVATWVKFIKFTPNVSQTIVGCATSGYKLWKAPAGKIQFTVQLFDGTFATAEFDQSLIEDADQGSDWHFIAGLYARGKISIFLDGLLQEQQPADNLIYYQDDTINNIASKQLYVGLESNLVSLDQMVRILFLSAREDDDRITVINLNPTAGTTGATALFYDDTSSTPNMIDYYFFVNAEQTGPAIFNAPVSTPTNTGNQIWVFTNGLLQKEGASDDYTITDNGSDFDVVFPTTKYIGDIVQVYVIPDSKSASIEREDVAATGGQTSFTTNQSYTNDEEHLLVFCNGVIQTPGAGNDYTETGANSFAFTSGREADDRISWFTFYGSEYFDRQTFTSSEGQTNFLLNPVHDIEDSVLVFANGLHNIRTEDYIVSTENLANVYLRNTRIEPGRFNIIQSFIYFLTFRTTGDIVQVAHLNPDDGVPGAFEEIFVVNQSTDTFVVSRETPSNVANHVLVFLNGILQQQTENYTVTSGSTETTITFTSNRFLNDIVKVVLVNENTTTLTRQDIDVASDQTVFNIGAYTNDNEHLLVFTNGITNVPDMGATTYDYAETSGTQITFNTPRKSGDVVTVFKLAASNKVERDVYNVSVAEQYQFDFAVEYSYFVYGFVSSSGIMMSVGEDYTTTEPGTRTNINVNPQVIQNWYENDLIYDWRYRKVIA